MYVYKRMTSLPFFLCIILLSGCLSDASLVQWKFEPAIGFNKSSLSKWGESK